MSLPNTRQRKVKPTHPGEMLREDFLPEYDLSVAAFARAVGVSRQTVNELLRERRSLSPEMALRLENAYNRYRELSYLRRSIKISFSLTLSLVLVASLMAALIAAFHTATRLVQPVADIARGTRAVAEGDYEQQD